MFFVCILIFPSRLNCFFILKHDLLESSRVEQSSMNMSSTVLTQDWSHLDLGNLT